MQFGSGLKAMRAIRKVSQIKLAQAAGMTVWELSRAESGRLNLKHEQEERIRLELCWPKVLDAHLDALERYHYEQ